MPLLLNFTSNITCDHKTGQVMAVPTQLWVKISGFPILCKGDAQMKPIVGCTNIATTIKPCLITQAEAGGHSAFIKIGGKPVTLDTLIGKTDGTPPAVVDYKVLKVAQNFVRGS